MNFNQNSVFSNTPVDNTTLESFNLKLEKFFNQLEKVQEIQNYLKTSYISKVDLSLLSHQLSKFPNGGPSFRSESQGNTIESLKLRCEGVFGSIWDSILKMFKWIGDFISGLFGGSSSSKSYKSSRGSGGSGKTKPKTEKEKKEVEEKKEKVKELKNKKTKEPEHEKQKEIEEEIKEIEEEIKETEIDTGDIVFKPGKLTKYFTFKNIPEAQQQLRNFYKLKDSIEDFFKISLEIASIYHKETSEAAVEKIDELINKLQEILTESSSSPVVFKENDFIVTWIVSEKFKIILSKDRGHEETTDVPGCSEIILNKNDTEAKELMNGFLNLEDDLHSFGVGFKNEFTKINSNNIKIIEGLTKKSETVDPEKKEEFLVIVDVFKNLGNQLKFLASVASIVNKISNDFTSTLKTNKI